MTVPYQILWLELGPLSSWLLFRNHSDTVRLTLDNPYLNQLLLLGNVLS